MFEQEINDPEFKWFVQEVNKKLGLDLSGYKPHRVKRRTDILLRKYATTSYRDYMGMINKDPAKKEEFLDKLTINVTEFFRNPEKFDKLRDVFLPKMLRESGSRTKLWSAGCSSGEEPYSLGILLEELRAPSSVKVKATDIDSGVLAKSRRGVYESRAFTSTPQNIVQKYFRKSGEDQFEVIPQVKSRVSFQYHNMLQDPFDKDIDLIVCRNVVIYFEMETKNQLYKRFSSALRPGGILFVGSTERIFNYRQLNLTVVEPFFYRKES